MKKLVLALLLLLPATVFGQVNGGSAPYTFAPNTTILSSEVNTNFSTLFSDALNRTGGTMTGTLNTRTLLPVADNTYDLGSATYRYRNVYVVGAIAAGGSGSFSDAVTITTTNNPQFSFKYDTSNYGTLYASGTGALTFDAVGSGASFTFNDASTFASTLAVTGATTLGGQLKIADGTVSTPSFSFTSDTNTGLYWKSACPFAFAIDGVDVFCAKIDNQKPVFDLLYGAWGTGTISGSLLGIGNNTSGNGAAGSIVFYEKDWNNNSEFRFVWVDTNHLLRIGNVPPYEDGSVSDTSGTVVGDQSSSYAVKDHITYLADPQPALDTVLRTPVFTFTYKDGRYNGETFTGVITDFSPEFAKDNGKSLDEVSAIGLLIQAVQAQQAQIEELKARVTALEAQRR